MVLGRNQSCRSAPSYDLAAPIRGNQGGVMRQTPILLAAALLCSCNTFSTEVQRNYQEGTGWTLPIVFTTADVRVITERPHPLLQKPVMRRCRPLSGQALSSAAAVRRKGTTASRSLAQRSFSGAVGRTGRPVHGLVRIAGRALPCVRGLFQWHYRSGCKCNGAGPIWPVDDDVVRGAGHRLRRRWGHKGGCHRTSPVVGSRTE